MDTRLALMAGSDIPIPECQLIIHQPTIKEISYLGERDFFVGVQTISVYKSMFVSEDKDASDNITNFQIFMTIVNQKEMQDKKEVVKQVFLLIFPKYQVLFTPRSLVFRSESGETYTVDDSNFESLQQAVRDIFCANTGPMDQQAFNPANDAAREIAEKIMRGRQRVAAQNSEEQSSIFSQYLSILTIGAQQNLASLLNCTVFQLYDLMERYSLYMNWDIDMKCRLAGGKPESQPENWMKNIH